MYSKTGGKNAKNEWVSVTSNISALSKVAIQVFEHSHGRQFSSRPTKTASLNVAQFALLPSYNILTLLMAKPQNINASGFEISLDDMYLFKRLEGGLDALNKAMKTFKKRNKD